MDKNKEAIIFLVLVVISLLIVVALPTEEPDVRCTSEYMDEFGDEDCKDVIEDDLIEESLRDYR